MPLPAGYWQAARSSGAYTLVGCTVAPAFQYRDFAMLKDFPVLAGKIGSDGPIVAVLSGGNVDPDLFQRLIEP